MPRTSTRTAPLSAVAVAACAFSALVSDAQDAGNGRVLMQITPAQDFLPSDGREMDVPAWRINEAIAGRVSAAYNPAQPPVIDYEHQTLHKEANGQPAPAAGWIHGLRWLDGKGLYAEVELTQRARELVAAGEYRYFSPVFEYAKSTGDVVRVLMGALTNHPAIHGMDAINLMAAATARFGANPHPNPPETTVTLLEKLLAAIGLPASTTADAAIAACSSIQSQAEAARAALRLDGTATAETVTAACTSLRTAAASATPDPAKYVPVAVVEELKTSVAALTAQVGERQVEDLIAPALKDGRLLPAQEAWARDLGKTNVAALTAYLKTAQPIAALAGTQTGGKPPAGEPDKDAHGLTKDELAVAAACGLTPEAYAKGKA